jgi:hypothetical protein
MGRGLSSVSVRVCAVNGLRRGNAHLLRLLHAIGDVTYQTNLSEQAKLLQHYTTAFDRHESVLEVPLHDLRTPLL